MDNKVIGKRIKEMRLLNKITQNELALQLDLTEKYISNIETGTTNCGFPTMLQLANILNCSIDYLLGENLEYNNSKNNGNIKLNDLSFKLNSLNDNQIDFIDDIVNSLIVRNIK